MKLKKEDISGSAASIFILFETLFIVSAMLNWWSTLFKAQIAFARFIADILRITVLK